MEYEFTLTVFVGNCTETTVEMVERLGSAGCTDAVVGIGRSGYISLTFSRDAKSLDAAIASAREAVMTALPAAILVD